MSSGTEDKTARPRAKRVKTFSTTRRVQFNNSLVYTVNQCVVSKYTEYMARNIKQLPVIPVVDVSEVLIKYCNEEHQSRQSHILLQIGGHDVIRRDQASCSEDGSTKQHASLRQRKDQRRIDSGTQINALLARQARPVVPLRQRKVRHAQYQRRSGKWTLNVSLKIATINEDCSEDTSEENECELGESESESETTQSVEKIEGSSDSEEENFFKVYRSKKRMRILSSSDSEDGRTSIPDADYSLNSKIFNDADDVKLHLIQFFAGKNQKFYEHGIMTLPERWQNVIDKNKKYLIE
ncbi:hypothetical protein WN51_12518 [Melipona quadrifasciata]|uniref:Uncharacterized protein n=1 Tax=Melipona quadrifasciata TaxID=166423 RepID=A0A0N0BHB9_9HYME|nr:hypothetical protein WN51_12518 [Melipona quadrifasciata]